MQDGVWNSLFMNLVGKAKASSPPFEYGESAASVDASTEQGLLKVMCSMEFLHLDRKPWASPPPTGVGVASVVLRMAEDGLELVPKGTA